MATTGSNATTSAGSEANGSNVPQWKRDLIQRRRQQSKVLANNGISVKLCSAVIGTSASSTTDSVVEQDAAVQEHCPVAGTFRAARLTTTCEDAGGGASVAATCGSGNGASLPCSFTIGGPATPSPSFAARRPPTCGAIVAGGIASCAADFASSVACNMRLEADLSLCSDAEDVVNGASERKPSEYIGDSCEGEETLPRTPDGKMRTIARTKESECGEIRGIALGRGKDPLAGIPLAGRTKESSRMAPTGCASASDDAESDSSEELQYGPGIVNKLKSKYLNLTLRETNKNRASVQRFRRAASLEDLLDRDDDEASSGREKTVSRKYTKRNSGPTCGSVIGSKTDRYRNVCRGNDSIKRARSVETLMRYNTAMADEATTRLPGRPTTNGVRQEPVSDHIILVDRTSLKIESRLSEIERPKAVNKPKRIKPVLAETERPPPDLVRTTMRIFECSARRLKPKGEVAAKVATFKTINDTFKAQTQKKMLTKPPVQPKPFVNGGTRGGGLGSPKRIVLPRKPTAELIETQDGQMEYHMDGVITEPIAQSVFSVVSKFQQIEKSHSPSPSPEPSGYKFKFSPANSPEPPPQSSLCKLKSALEINVKSPPVTPVLSPRISSPRLQSPSSPVKDVRQCSPGAQSGALSPVKDPPQIQTTSPLHKRCSPLSSPARECSKVEPDPPKFLRSQIEKECPRTNVERPWQARLTESPVGAPKRKEDAKPSDEENEDAVEMVDGPRTISKTALDNIGKAGTTMQFNFGDKPAAEKSYLPGAKQNGQKSMDERVSEDERCSNVARTETRGKSVPATAPAAVATASEVTSRLQERLQPEKERKVDDGREDAEDKPYVVENKPIGAICSLGMMKAATTTMTTITTTSTTSSAYSQGNEAKMIRCQKSEFSPPQKQIGIIRPLVSTKAQHPQQNLSNRELEKNLINRVKSIEQPTKVVVSLKTADEIQAKKGGTGGGSGGGLWDTKPWNQQNNTMVFNFSNRKDVPDYIENDGLIIRRKREKPKVGNGGIIVLDATLDASTTDDAEWEISGGPPSPCDVSFFNDNVLINGRSNLSKTPRNHKHRIQFDDTATRTFEYPSEASILEGETSSVDGETSGTAEQQSTTTTSNNKMSAMTTTTTITTTSTSTTTTTTTTNSTTGMPSLLGGGGLANYTPSKVDLTSDGFELGITRAVPMVVSSSAPTEQTETISEMEYLRPAQDAGAWGSETTGDLLY